MASGIYTAFKVDLFSKQVDLSSASGSDVVKGALMDSSHAFDPSDGVWGDVSANEVADDSGSGYTAGGEEMTNKSITAGVTTYWDTDDITWSAATFAADHLVIRSVTNSDSLICSLDFGGTQSPSGIDFVVQFDPTGIIELT